ncbi:hypothetical protein J7K18_00270 [bacterium]|nr:hypothetical protein [bacterium]
MREKIVVISLLTVAFVAFAVGCQQSPEANRAIMERLDQLEKRVADLELQLNELKSGVEKPEVQPKPEEKPAEEAVKPETKPEEETAKPAAPAPKPKKKVKRRIK